MIHEKLVKSIRYSCFRRVHIRFIYSSKFDLAAKSFVTNSIGVGRWGGGGGGGGVGRGDPNKYIKRMIHEKLVKSIRYSCFRRVHIRFIYSSKFDLAAKSFVTNSIGVGRWGGGRGGGATYPLPPNNQPIFSFNFYMKKEKITTVPS